VYASQRKVGCVGFYGQETFDKEVIRIRKSKDRQHNGTEFAYYSFAIVTKFENNTKARKGQIMAKNIKGQNKY
jgi:hypothetical protein